MRGIDGAELEGSKVVLRTDINLPVEDGEPQPTVRFKRYMETVELLSDRGARTLIVAHQGRPSRKDFLSLEKHAELVSDELGREVDFVQCFFGDDLGEKIASMENGDVAVLENIRFLSEELQNIGAERHSHDHFVRSIARHFDVFVGDAFSAAHRSHGSMVGFTPILESYAGPVMLRELDSCRKVRDELENPLLVLGGEKPSDIVGMLENMVDRAEKVLLAGVPGELALTLEGNSLGKKSEWIAEKGFNGRRRDLKKILERYGDRILLPEDVRTETGNYPVGEVPRDEMTWDIGERTQQKFVDEIDEADSILMKGPMGAFEDHPDGTRAVVDAIASSEGYTVLGGGHTSSLVQRFGHGIEDFTHVSIAGGSFVRYMSGEELPAVEALERYGRNS